MVRKKAQTADLPLQPLGRPARPASIPDFLSSLFDRVAALPLAIHQPASFTPFAEKPQFLLSTSLGAR